MAKILITGGTGTLGNVLSKLLAGKGIEHTIASRHKPPGQNHWAQIDLQRNIGITEALKDKEVIIHLAHNLKNLGNENESTLNLLNSITDKSKTRLIYISVVGIDSVQIEYYEQKLLSEKAIIESGIPYSILRATQFHEFVDKNISSVMKFPVVTLPKNILVQPVQTEVVAQHLAKLLGQAPTNRIDNIGGQKTYTLSELLKAWQKATGNRTVVFNLPLFGQLGKALNEGKLTCEKNCHESISWEEWLANKYHKKPFY